MKFLCDRCKTRYSIGDERVRGKILKIRCKNCANVITVREGMPEPDAVPATAGSPRRTKTTTAAPVVSEMANAMPHGHAQGQGNGKPPPALEEEWYVSIDGDQAGPFSLAEAQRWVAGKPFDAELHCWSEGFDDWLPVDKVSHFRGLRKKAAPPPTPPSAMPPPIPRITGPARAITSAAARIPEEEHTPKPLFAATMASLEKSAPVSAASVSNVSNLSSGAAAVGALRVEARAVPTPVPAPAKPLNGARPVVPATTPAMTSRGVSLRAAGLGAAKPLFDPDLGGATQTESPPFHDEQPTTADPAATAAAAAQTKPMPHLKSVTPDTTAAPNDAFLDALARERNAARADKPMLSLASMASASTSASTSNDAPTLRADQPAPQVPDPTSIDGDDDIDIGEVSRVVKLADLARPAPATAKRTGAVSKITGPVGRVTGSVPKINGTGAVPLINTVDAVPGGNPMAMEPIAEPPPHSKRGLIILLVGAALLLGAAAVVLVIKLNTPEDITGLGGQFEYNPERPDNPITRRPDDIGPGSATVEPPQNPFIPKPPKIPTKPTTPIKVDPPAGNSLKSDEIEAMARSTSSTTTVCFRRASKGADDIILADVKKIRVAFHVNADGSVAANSVDLSEKRSATLSSCIQRMVAGWKFRPNSGGDFGFVFAKPD